MLFPLDRTGAFCAFCLLAVMPSAATAQPNFFRRGLADPPAQEVTTEFLFGESGGIEPRKGTAWKVQFARGLHKGLYITGAWFSAIWARSGSRS